MKSLKSFQLRDLNYDFPFTFYAIQRSTKEQWQWELTNIHSVHLKLERCTFLNIGGGVRLSPLGTCATGVTTVLAPDDR